MPERLKAARHKAVGAKQTVRALKSGQALVVYIAVDADRRLVRPVREIADQLNVDVVVVDTMSQLGRLCSIDVGAACASLLIDSKQVRQNA